MPPSITVFSLFCTYEQLVWIIQKATRSDHKCFLYSGVLRGVRHVSPAWHVQCLRQPDHLRFPQRKLLQGVQAHLAVVEGQEYSGCPLDIPVADQTRRSRHCRGPTSRRGRQQGRRSGLRQQRGRAEADQEVSRGGRTIRKRTVKSFEVGIAVNKTGQREKHLPTKGFMKTFTF